MDILTSIFPKIDVIPDQLSNNHCNIAQALVEGGGPYKVDALAIVWVLCHVWYWSYVLIIGLLQTIPTLEFVGHYFYNLINQGFYNKKGKNRKISYGCRYTQTLPWTLEGQIFESYVCEMLKVLLTMLKLNVVLMCEALEEHVPTCGSARGMLYLESLIYYKEDFSFLFFLGRRRSQRQCSSSSSKTSVRKLEACKNELVVNERKSSSTSFLPETIEQCEKPDEQRKKNRRVAASSVSL
ncbi:hypothetical protein M9H77_09601 [Catharanthus roseus]|uniref:Uncharacterized protein n=1 Tax=Catharanthus roseus TaxID=4058 RepID=A0ACC0C179_CATRO|nr:hypothetical protein M9H77_09601 [Catharanthus roseus]